MPDINTTDLADRLMREGVDKAEAWDAIAAKNAIIASQAAEISRLRDALRAALPAIDGYVDRCDFTKGNAIREIARTALEASHG